MTNEIIIKLEEVHKFFQKNTVHENHVLRGVDLDIYPGDFITVIGGNGAGKSTMLNAIAGSFPINKGDILLQGKPIKQKKEEERAKNISRVFQDPLMGTAPRMTIAENLNIARHRGEFRGLHNSLTDEVREELKLVLGQLGIGLENRLDEEVGLLSGGQRQMIALMMATIKKPDVLLLDEHIAALDPAASERVMSLTDQRVKEKNITTLMITHNMQDAVNYGNRLIMMDQGRIVYDVREEEKESLTVDNLLDLFKERQAEKRIPDSMVL